MPCISTQQHDVNNFIKKKLRHCQARHQGCHRRPTALQALCLRMILTADKGRVEQHPVHACPAVTRPAAWHTAPLPLQQFRSLDNTSGSSSAGLSLQQTLIHPTTHVPTYAHCMYMHHDLVTEPASLLSNKPPPGASCTTRSMGQTPFAVHTVCTVLSSCTFKPSTGAA
jgi:hypothetical protein